MANLSKSGYQQDVKCNTFEHLCAHLPVNFTRRVISTDTNVRKSCEVTDTSHAGQSGPDWRCSDTALTLATDGTLLCEPADDTPHHPPRPADRPRTEMFLRELRQDMRNVLV